ncbi:SCO2583/SCO2584 N-terminal domain-containing protein [Streptomyces sp. NPDC001705]
MPQTGSGPGSHTPARQEVTRPMNDVPQGERDSADGPALDEAFVQKATVSEPSARSRMPAARRLVLQ